MPFHLKLATGPLEDDHEAHPLLVLRHGKTQANEQAFLATRYPSKLMLADSLAARKHNYSSFLTEASSSTSANKRPSLFVSFTDKGSGEDSGDNHSFSDGPSKKGMGFRRSNAMTEEQFDQIMANIEKELKEAPKVKTLKRSNASEALVLPVEGKQGGKKRVGKLFLFGLGMDAAGISNSAVEFASQNGSEVLGSALGPVGMVMTAHSLKTSQAIIAKLKETLAAAKGTCLEEAGEDAAKKTVCEDQAKLATCQLKVARRGRNLSVVGAVTGVAGLAGLTATIGPAAPLVVGAAGAGLGLLNKAYSSGKCTALQTIVDTNEAEAADKDLGDVLETLDHETNKSADS